MDMVAEYYSVEPEVAGGWGDDTKIIRIPGRPVTADRLHYEFDGWLGDDLLESTPFYIATAKLSEAILESGLSGVEFEDVKISKSPQFEDLHPNRDLPKFLWMKPGSNPSRDDFGLTSDLQLIVSARALAVLESFEIAHASIEPIGSGTG